MPINWEDSTTYQWIFRKGFVQGMQKAVLLLGEAQLGPASETTETAVRAITDQDRLERMIDRVFDAAGWDEVLATP